MRVDLKPVLSVLGTHCVRREHYGPRFDKWNFSAKGFNLWKTVIGIGYDWTTLLRQGFTYLFLAVTVMNVYLHIAVVTDSLR